MNQSSQALEQQLLEGAFSCLCQHSRKCSHYIPNEGCFYCVNKLNPTEKCPEYKIIQHSLSRTTATEIAGKFSHGDGIH